MRDTSLKAGLTGELIVHVNIEEIAGDAGETDNVRLRFTVIHAVSYQSPGDRSPYP